MSYIYICICIFIQFEMFSNFSCDFFFLIHVLFRDVVFNFFFCHLGILPDIFLLVVFSLILLRSENIFCIILIPLKSLRFVL